jgi:hypothetical protein
VNAIEAGELLAVCAAFDRRTTGPSDVLAWTNALGDLPFGDCEKSVIAHYNDTDDWVMPVHVRRRVRAMRADRIARAPRPELPDAFADNPVAWIDAYRERTRGLGDSPQRLTADQPRAIGDGS